MSELKGNPNECALCGRPRSAHESIILKCPRGHGYFRPKFNHDGTLDHEHTDEPVCPWCGYRMRDFWEISGIHDEDNTRVECPECEQPYDSSCCITYSFTTKRVDLEFEARNEAEAKAVREQRRLKRLAACEPFVPGMRVRVLRTNYKGRLGTVENKELSKHNPFVNVVLDPEEEGRKPYSTFFSAEELEVVCGSG